MNAPRGSDTRRHTARLDARGTDEIVFTPAPSPPFFVFFFCFYFLERGERGFPGRRRLILRLGYSVRSRGLREVIKLLAGDEGLDFARTGRLR